MINLEWTSSIKELPENIVEAASAANVFYTDGYAAMQAEKGATAIYLYDEAFLWVVFLKRKFVFRYAFIPTEYVLLKKINEEEERTHLDEAVRVLQKKLKCQWIGPTGVTAMFHVAPKNSRHIPFGNQLLDLTEDEEVLWNNIHSKHKNSIRKAEKDGVHICSGNSEELLEKFLLIDAQTWRRSGIETHTRMELEPMLKNMKDNLLVALAERNGEVQAGAVFLYNKEMAYYMYGATKDHPSTGSANLLQWKSILEMKHQGVKRYSFVGYRFNAEPDSKYYSIQRFKGRFGPSVDEGVMFKCIFNKPMYNLSRFVVSLFKNHGKKSLDIIEQEYPKWHLQGKSIT